MLMLAMLPQQEHTYGTFKVKGKKIKIELEMDTHKKHRFTLATQGKDMSPWIENISAWAIDQHLS